MIFPVMILAGLGALGVRAYVQRRRAQETAKAMHQLGNALNPISWFKKD